MPKPEDVQAVQRLVNTVKYLSRFLEDLSDMSEPLRRLTHKDVPWEWSQEQEEAFVKIKKAVSTAPLPQVNLLKEKETPQRKELALRSCNKVNL